MYILFYIYIFLYLNYFLSYVNDEKKTAEGYTADGFWKSGDLAVLNEDGTLRLIFLNFWIKPDRIFFSELWADQRT